ncbi:RNA-binding protein Musashi 2 [Liparis tanakae]|uniref:RNA-binding protein Musashi 2 n=1 Tax=Liparis tanakae TaxID=230148 RepID=A0A4Z2J9C7_9TELE|nr:RNA-binding protein Musashi 2 [Liparis tanakae]
MKREKLQKERERKKEEEKQLQSERARVRQAVCICAGDVPMVTRTKKIFVGGLSANTVVEDVKQYFEQFGKCFRGLAHTAGAVVFTVIDKERNMLKVCIRSVCDSHLNGTEAAHCTVALRAK